MLKTVKHRHFQQSRECISEMNESVWPVFKLMRDYINVQLTCKFKKDPIKNERVTLMTKSKKCLFSNLGDVTYKINDPIWQFSKSFQIYPCTPYLQDSGTFSQKLKGNDKHFPIVSLREKGAEGRWTDKGPRMAYHPISSFHPGELKTH